MGNNYLDQLSQIKGIIEERTRFNFLSGLSGIFAGVYALIGAYAAYRIIYSSDYITYHDLTSLNFRENSLKLVLIFLTVLVFSIVTALYFSYRKAKKSNDKLWNYAALKVLENFAIPMFIGAMFIMFLFYYQFVTLISASSLIFYGLALINAANYTFSDVKKLGLTICAIGLVSLAFPGQGLFFWAMGFGVAHIVYGIIMYYKYGN